MYRRLADVSMRKMCPLPDHLANENLDAELPDGQTGRRPSDRPGPRQRSRRPMLYTAVRADGSEQYKQWVSRRCRRHRPSDVPTSPRFHPPQAIAVGEIRIQMVPPQGFEPPTRCLEGGGRSALWTALDS